MSRRSDIWTIANVITCVRILLTFFWLALAEYLPGPQGGHISVEALVVALVFLMLVLTDKIDGHLARSRNEITNMGKFLDPIADKLLVLSALIMLVRWDYVSIWIPVLIMAREFLVSGLRMIVASSGVVLAANSLGKGKTATTMISLCAYFLARALPHGPLRDAILFGSGCLMLLALFLTIWSGIDYLLRSKEYLTHKE